MIIMTLIRLAGADRDAFEAYEAAVLPLLGDYGGTLERRLRSTDGSVETHLLRFPSAEAFQNYLRDPRRLAAADLWTRSGATAEVWSVEDIRPAAGRSPEA